MLDAFDVSMKGVPMLLPKIQFLRQQYIVVTGIEELGENLTAVLLISQPNHRYT
jgi:hypothetical protein